MMEKYTGLILVIVAIVIAYIFGKLIEIVGNELDKKK